MMSRVDALPDFEYGQHGATLAVDTNDVRLRRVAVAHVRDVPNVDWRGADGPDWKIVELFDLVGAAVQADVVFDVADLRGSAGKDQVLHADRVDHVVWR